MAQQRPTIANQSWGTHQALTRALRSGWVVLRRDGLCEFVRRVSTRLRQTWEKGSAKPFAPVLKVWKPQCQPPVVYLHWLMTEWCHYRCAYCPQSHDRKAPRGKHTAHAFDNYSVERWLAAFRHHFSSRCLSLKITGGEPMLDRRNMVPLLRGLIALPTLAAVRIDTNAFWDPTPYAGLDRRKVILMCTYHPTEVSEALFLERIDRLLAAGFRIGMVNLVMTHEQFARYQSLKVMLADRGVPLHPNPLWGATDYYTAPERELLRRELPSADYGYRSETLSPLGKPCLHPALAYRLDQTGHIAVGCHEDRCGNLFDATLPELFAGPVACPHRSCVCLDMYSFLGEVNRNRGVSPLHIYSAILRARGA
jgi:hypothetical protein